MAEKLKEVLKVEFDRNTPESRRKIFLFRDGSFLRPYEISCWMFQRFIFDGYKVSCRTYKGYKDPVCLIGFPPASLKKLLSAEKCKGIQQIGNIENENIGNEFLCFYRVRCLNETPMQDNCKGDFIY